MVYLVKMLDRSNVELLILAITFLKKLSIYKENKVCLPAPPPLTAYCVLLTAYCLLPC